MLYQYLGCFFGFSTVVGIVCHNQSIAFTTMLECTGDICRIFEYLF